MRMPVRALCLLLLLAVPVAAADYAAILADAVDRIDDNFHREWAFTETTAEYGVTTAARYNPSMPTGERWTLLTVARRAPTRQELAEFPDEKAGESFDDSDDGGVGDLFQPGSLTRVRESDDHWVFDFVPSEEEFDEGMAEHVDGTVRIARQGPYIESIELRNPKPFRPRFGVKISELLTRLTFGPAAAGGPIVPQAVEVRIKARAFLAISIDETMSISYSDYEYVGDSPGDRRPARAP